MGTLAEMRHLSALTVEATFEGEVPDLSVVPGVTSVQVVGHVARCQVRGTIEPLLKVLAASDVRELLSREPSLEELFLAQYGAASEPAQPKESGEPAQPKESGEPAQPKESGEPAQPKAASIRVQPKAASIRAQPEETDEAAQPEETDEAAQPDAASTPGEIGEASAHAS
jgi:hypothetical protein